MDVLGANAVAARRDRLQRVRERMGETGVDLLLLSHGADLPWLTGYRAMPLERVTMLVLPIEGDPILVVPGLEAPRVAAADSLFSLVPWSDHQDPIAIITSMVDASARRVAISDRAWAVTVLALGQALPKVDWLPSSTVVSPVRAIKDPSELRALRAAAEAADRVAAQLQAGEIELIGQRESDVSANLSRRLIDEGHSCVNFAIVGSGPNAASPHHEPGSRIIGPNETVVCDFGGALSLDGDIGYCSDITRTVMTGEPSSEIRDCYEVLQAAQSAAVLAACSGVTAESVDQVARDFITVGGYGEFFFHRTGHGIGIEEHEDPYLVAGNDELLHVGHAFSVEPGIYLEGRFGMRLEDIVIVGQDGQPESLNQSDHGLVVLDA